MIKLYQHGNHKEVFQCFITYIENLEKEINNKVKYPVKFKLKSQKQLVPFGHLRLVTASLLCLNTKESFEQMKIVIQMASACHSFLNNTSLASCFLLALNQNDMEYAMKMAARIQSKVNKF